MHKNTCEKIVLQSCTSGQKTTDILKFNKYFKHSGQNLLEQIRNEFLQRSKIGQNLLEQICKSLRQKTGFQAV
jgi:hypothetical protein